MDGFTWGDMERTEREEYELPLLFVNVYSIDRVYGGPEESGWWFTCGKPFTSIYSDSEEEAKQVFQTMQEKYSKERDVQVVLESGFAKPFPEEKPFYE